MDQRKRKSQYQILNKIPESLERSGSGTFKRISLYELKETLLFYIKLVEDKRLELLTPESKSGALPLN